MSQDNGVPEASDESPAEDVAAVTLIKSAIQALVDDESLTLLERLNALLILRDYLDAGIDLLEQELDKG